MKPDRFDGADGLPVRFDRPAVQRRRPRLVSCVPALLHVEPHAENRESGRSVYFWTLKLNVTVSTNEEGTSFRTSGE